MNVRLLKSLPGMSLDIRNVTSLPGSVGGVTRSGLRDGTILVQSGQVPAPANPSPLPESSRGLPTPATSGPTGSGSSRNQSLKLCLESKLKLLSGMDGSILFNQTWREKVTPLGRRYWAHTASGARISGSGFTSAESEIAWPTPQAHKHTKNSKDSQRMKEGGVQTALADAAWLSQGWPTPTAGTPAQNGNNEAGNTDSSRKTVALVGGWPTPNTSSEGPNFKSTPTHTGGMDLEGAATLVTRNVEMVGWKTPNCPRANDSDNTAGRGYASKKQQDLPDQVVSVVGGEILNGSTAATRSIGQLNPAFSRWLMVYPAEWDACAPTATRSSRKSRQSSSKLGESVGHEPSR